MNKLKNITSSPYSKNVDCISDYPVVDTGWIIKRWFTIDQKKLVDWYYSTKENFKEWFWTYGQNKDMWKYDPNHLTGNGLQHDTAWLMLTWGDNRKGPVPWLRYIAKPEYDTVMPRNDGKEPLGNRECCTGYALEIFKTMPCAPHDIQIALHTPGTKLPPHQDKEDKLRFHIPIITNPDARFIINGNDLHLPADGWCYLINTTYLHSTNNKGATDRAHIYGSVWTNDVLNLNNIDSLETVL
jgi:hypothetical protein